MKFLRAKWLDVNYDHYIDTDNQQIYMIGISRGLVEIDDDLILAFDLGDKIVVFKIYEIPNLLHIFFDQGNAQFVINQMYYKDSDILEINFVNFIPLIVNFKKTEVEGIEMGMDHVGKLVCLHLCNFKKNEFMSKSLSEEERDERLNRSIEIMKDREKSRA
ncbi:879_t:CDS:2, partial [Funneliformis mosseae]